MVRISTVDPLLITTAHHQITEGITEVIQIDDSIKLLPNIFQELLQLQDTRLRCPAPDTHNKAVISIIYKPYVIVYDAKT